MREDRGEQVKRLLLEGRGRYDGWYAFGRMFPRNSRKVEKTEVTGVDNAIEIGFHLAENSLR